MPPYPYRHVTSAGLQHLQVSVITRVVLPDEWPLLVYRGGTPRMSLPTFNTKSPTIKRILKEAAELSTNPDPTLHAAPLESNLFEWHFTLRGPPSTPYAAGAYHGRIILPQQYPLRPPSFRFMTPSGRFEPNREICLSISGHHEETWQPAWGIRTALWALRAFMEGGAKGQVGGMEMGEAERRRLAEESRGWKCNGCGGRSNEEILKAQEENSGDNAGNSKADIPMELMFGFKDEMQKDAKAELTDMMKPTGSETKGDFTRSIEPQEIVNTPSSSTAIQTTSSTSTATQSSPAPVPSVTPLSQPQLAQPRPAAQLPTQEAVPGWIDKAIVGLVATLLVMIFKKLMAWFFLFSMRSIGWHGARNPASTCMQALLFLLRDARIWRVKRLWASEMHMVLH